MPGKTWKLTYFKGRGRAESIRMILLEAGVPFEDNRISKEEWAEIKDSTPTQKLPILEIDNGMVLSQSPAIIRFLGRKFGMYSNIHKDQYRMDMIMDTIDDLVDKVLIPVLLEKDPVKKADQMKKVETEDLPGYMEFFTRELKLGGGEFFVGTEMSVADLHVFSVVDNMAGAFPEFIAKWEAVSAFLKRMESRPKLAAWIKGRPKSWF